MTLAFGLDDIKHLENPIRLKNTGVKFRNIAEVLQFPDYNYPSAYYDVALVKLSEPVPLGERIWPICLPNSENENKNHLKGDFALVAGKSFYIPHAVRYLLHSAINNRYILASIEF